MDTRTTSSWFQRQQGEHPLAAGSRRVGVSSYGFLAVDLGIVAIVAVSGVLAFSRGFVRELIALGALAVAAAATYYLFPILLPTAEGFIGSADIAAGATIVVLFVGALILALILGRPIAARTGGSGASSVDRWLGLAFGVARGAVIVVVGYILFEVVIPVPDQPAWLQEARLISAVQSAADWALSFLPPDLQDEVVLSAQLNPVPVDTLHSPQ